MTALRIKLALYMWTTIVLALVVFALAVYIVNKNATPGKDEVLPDPEPTSEQTPALAPEQASETAPETLAFGNNALFRDTLKKVKDRGKLVCGVDGYKNGFSYGGVEVVDEEDGLFKEVLGFEADLCRVVATAIFGSAKNRLYFKKATMENVFTGLIDGNTDVVFRSITWTSDRDVSEGVDFGPVYYHDGQKILASQINGVVTARQLGGGRVCVIGETTSIDNLKKYVSLLGFTTELLTAENIDIERNASIVYLKTGDVSRGKYIKKQYEHHNELVAAFQRAESHRNKCDFITGDESTLVGSLTNISNTLKPIVFPEKPISYEPISVVVAEGDRKWREIISYAVWAVLWAEQEGISKENSISFAEKTWTKLGLDIANTKKIISQNGNYKEIYDSHLKDLISVRGKNHLQINLGLMAPPPLEPSIAVVTDTLDINFEKASSTLSDGQKDELTALCRSWDEMEGSEILTIQVTGHADSIGGAEFNLKLSEDRAESVGKYLESLIGCIEAEILTERKGESELKNTGESEEDHAINRRAELKARFREKKS